METGALQNLIKKLSAQNKLQENEIETLRNSLDKLEEEKIQLIQQNESLVEENILLKQENDQLKIVISELPRGPEIIDVASDSEDEDNGNPHTGSTGTSSEIFQPLGNPLITQKFVSLVMKFVTRRDLGACRLVCKMWSLEARKQMTMRSTFYLDFFYPEKVKRFLQIAPTKFSEFRHLNLDISTVNMGNENRSLKKLLKDHGKSLHKVVVIFGNPDYIRMTKFLYTFLASLQEIKYLKLIRLPCALLEEDWIFNHGFQSLPNLTEIYIALKVNCHRTHRSTQVLGDLLRISPNLKTLYWKEEQNGGGAGHNGTKILIQSLIQINPSKLKYLYLHSQDDPIVATLLTTSQLKLKRLYFSKLNGFQVGLTTQCTGLKTELTPLREEYSQIPGNETKQILEHELARDKEANCITLLKKFLMLTGV